MEEIMTDQELYNALLEVKDKKKQAEDMYEILRQDWFERLEQSKDHDEYGNKIIRVKDAVIVKERRTTQQYDMDKLEIELKQRDLLNIASSLDMKKVKKLVSAGVFPKKVFDICEEELKVQFGLVTREEKT